MIKTFVDIFKVPELKKRVLFTLALIAVYRVGAAIPVPGVNAVALRSLFDASQNNLLGFMDMFSGGALSKLSIFSMGIMPYINASIMMSLLQGAHLVPYLDRLAKEGDLGRKKLNQLTRYFTLFLGAIQSFGLTLAMSRMPTPSGLSVVEDPTTAWVTMTVSCSCLAS